MLVGIDLGTTNSALCYADPSDGIIHTFSIPQKNSKGFFEKKRVLPSFLHVQKEEIVVGELAKEACSLTPLNVVHSAKSWLCHHTHARHEKILPEGQEEKALLLSPIEATEEILRYLRASWDREFVDFPLAEQLVVLTVPASFDEQARELTLKAAKGAGILNVLLLEEPQAAFYNFLSHQFNDADRILVVDVGGGTTDFSLIDFEKGSFIRKAVGDHLLLGGDNIDLFIAHKLEQQISSDVNIRLFAALKASARNVKETLFNDHCPEEITVEILGTGSSVIGGAHTLTLNRDSIRSEIMEGFWKCVDECPAPIPKHAVQDLSLPFAKEPNILLHLARFIKNHSENTKIDWVLFNGSQMIPKQFCDRVLVQVGGRPLQNKALDLAVARGAVQYALARSLKGPQIQGGLPRTYYIEVSGAKMMTILERGTNEDEKVTSPVTLKALVGSPAEFTLYCSSVRLEDRVGDLIEFDALTMTKVAPIATTLKYGKSQTSIDVNFSANLTSVGTFDLYLNSLSTEHSWKLQFQTRSSGGGDKREETSLLLGENFDQEILKAAGSYLFELFKEKIQDPKEAMRSLERILDLPRFEWSAALLRALFDLLIKYKKERLSSLALRARFWNLAGFCLRPGLGAPCDDFRVQELWKLYLEERRLGSTHDIEVQQWIAFRRIALGLKKGQQLQLAKEVTKDLFKKKNRATFLEKLRAFAALEMSNPKDKKYIGFELIKRVQETELWALGKLGTRKTAHGSIESLVDKTTCENWTCALLKLPKSDKLIEALALLTEESGVKQIDISKDLKDKVLEAHPEIAEISNSSHSLEDSFYGDQLPVGLISFT